MLTPAARVAASGVVAARPRAVVVRAVVRVAVLLERAAHATAEGQPRRQARHAATRRVGARERAAGRAGSGRRAGGGKRALAHQQHGLTTGAIVARRSSALSNVITWVQWTQRPPLAAQRYESISSESGIVRARTLTASRPPVRSVSSRSSHSAKSYLKGRRMGAARKREEQRRIARRMRGELRGELRGENCAARIARRRCAPCTGARAS